MKIFVGLPAEVITQGVSKIHEEFSKFVCAEYFEGTLEEKDRLVIETASQRPATLKNFRTQELAIEANSSPLAVSRRKSQENFDGPKSAKKVQN